MYLLIYRDPLESQRRVAMISEMIHTASLIHDDVIDQSNFRRGKPSVNVLWNHRKVSEVYLHYLSHILHCIRPNDVLSLLLQIIFGWGPFFLLFDKIAFYLRALAHTYTHSRHICGYLWKTLFLTLICI